MLFCVGLYYAVVFLEDSDLNFIGAMLVVFGWLEYLMQENVIYVHSDICLLG